jgi:hypothetical protein
LFIIWLKEHAFNITELLFFFFIRL